MANFANVNDRRSARRRYLMPRPEASGMFTQEERQMLRWLYSGLLLSTGIATVPFAIYCGEYSPGAGYRADKD